MEYIGEASPILSQGTTNFPSVSIKYHLNGRGGSPSPNPPATDPNDQPAKTQVRTSLLRNKLLEQSSFCDAWWPRLLE